MPLTVQTSVTRFPVFLSLVVVVRNQADSLADLLARLLEHLLPLANNCELIVVDNASKDDSIERFKALTGPDGLFNLQVFALTQQVDQDTASWVGLENALGDFIIVFNPHNDDINMMPKMIEASLSGNDIVFARNLTQTPQGIAYRTGRFVFNTLYKFFNGVHLTEETPTYRLLSRRVLNFIMQHPSPTLFYRRLPSVAGFSRENLVYSATPLLPGESKYFADNIDLGLRLLVSSTNAPLRLVTSLSLFGAFANLLYSIYVVIIYFVRENVTPGWTTTSLQQSGMFMLFSLVFLVLCEYILHMAADSNRGQPFHIAQEFTSSRIYHHQKLNIEEDTRTNTFDSGLRDNGL